MERSIEKIWKEGFLENNALVAPKINDLYNKKSNHIVDKFKRMYKINLIAIIVFAFIVLPFSFITKMPYMGIPMFFLFMVIVVINRKLGMKLEKIDNSQNSYLYLKSFSLWIKELVSINTNLSRYLYPFVFLSLISGFWFGGIGENAPGQEFVNELILEYPNTFLIFGLPLFVILGVLFVMGLLAFFGGIIGKWDLNLVYGRILKKLESLLTEMEELRS